MYEINNNMGVLYHINDNIYMHIYAHERREKISFPKKKFLRSKIKF